MSLGCQTHDGVDIGAEPHSTAVKSVLDNRRSKSTNGMWQAPEASVFFGDIITWGANSSANLNHGVRLWDPDRFHKVRLTVDTKWNFNFIYFFGELRSVAERFFLSTPWKALWWSILHLYRVMMLTWDDSESGWCGSVIMFSIILSQQVVAMGGKCSITARMERLW